MGLCLNLNKFKIKLKCLLTVGEGRVGNLINLQDLLDFIVQYKYESTTGTSENVREGTLEEGTGTFLFGDGGPAVHCVLVDDFGSLATRLHHHTTTDSIEWIGYNTSNSCNNLSDSPADVDGGVLRIGQHTTSSIVEAEVGSTVDDDTLYGDTETTVQTNKTIRFEDLGQAVAETGEFTGTTLASISGQAVKLQD